MYYERFEKLCTINNVKPGQVSRATGISTSTLSAWKMGRYTPKNDKLQLIADYFNVSISYFLDENDSTNQLYTDITKYIKNSRIESPEPVDATFNFEDLRLMANISCDAKRSAIFAWLAHAPEEDVSLILSLINRFSVKEGE